MAVSLRCPVRSCEGTLQQMGTRWTCRSNHSFDQHKSGYLNLLQPQDRRSNTPGDSREAALARRRLADLGYADALHHTLRRTVRQHSSRGPSRLLDVGCGEGAFLRSLNHDGPLERHGLDISDRSLALAARATPGILFVVANADRVLPYADQSFDVLTSLDARINEPEFRRVLASAGTLLVAVPGPDDLIELRERIQGAGLTRSRASRLLREFAEPWELVSQTAVRDTQFFDLPALSDLLTATYRGFRKPERLAAASLTPMTVTLEHEVLVFRPRPS